MAALSHPGILAIHDEQLQGGGEAPLTDGPDRHPRFSPDGSSVLFIRSEGTTSAAYRIGLVGGRERVLHAPEERSLGGLRVSPDGRRILFIGANAQGRSGVYIQDFVPGRDTSATRRAVAGFAPDLLTESFGVSPDGQGLALSTLQEYSSLTLAEGLTGLEPPRR